jgi:two-component sensor histidine kinase
LRGEPVDVSGSNRQAARERGFRLLAVTVTALFLTFAALGVAFQWYDATVSSVTRTREVRNGMSDVLQALTDAESAQRGYLLTGDTRFESQIAEARAYAARRLDDTARIIRETPEQQQRLERLRRLVAKRLAEVDETVALRRQGGGRTAAESILEGEGLAAMDGARLIALMVNREEATLEEARLARKESLRQVFLMALIGFAALLGALFLKAMRDLSLDREAEARVSEQLRQLVADRTLLIDEVNHRVKNSLQQIVSVIRLQTRSVTNPDAKAALDHTLSRIMAVGRVHEQLYKTGAAVGLFDAGAYAETLARELVDSIGGTVSLTTRVESVELEMSKAVPMALILNELITNALKYARGALEVEFVRRNDGCRLTVADNGPGLPADFTPSASSGLGMRAVEALTRQLEGRLIVERPAVGARLSIEFPA